MATLFERMIGQNLPSDGTASEEKLAIHAFAGALNEMRRGKLLGSEIAAMFNLDVDQQTDAIALHDLIVAAPEKTEFMRVFKDWLYLGETQTDAQYLVQANFVTRLQTEVTDQGGTLP